MTDRRISRGRFTAGTAAAFASIAVLRGPAQAAQWSYKYASNVTLDHPLNVRCASAGRRSGARPRAGWTSRSSPTISSAATPRRYPAALRRVAVLHPRRRHLAVGRAGRGDSGRGLRVQGLRRCVPRDGRIARRLRARRDHRQRDSTCIPRCGRTGCARSRRGRSRSGLPTTVEVQDSHAAERGVGRLVQIVRRIAGPAQLQRSLLRVADRSSTVKRIRMRSSTPRACTKCRSISV